MITHGDSSLLLNQAESADETPKRLWDFELWGTWDDLTARVRVDANRTRTVKYLVFSVGDRKWVIWRDNEVRDKAKNWSVPDGPKAPLFILALALLFHGCATRQGATPVPALVATPAAIMPPGLTDRTNQTNQGDATRAAFVTVPGQTVPEIPWYCLYWSGHTWILQGSTNGTTWTNITSAAADGMLRFYRETNHDGAHFYRMKSQ